MRDFMLTESDRAFRDGLRDFLMRELQPAAEAIEERDDWNAIKRVVRALGEAGYLKLMFRDLYRGGPCRAGPYPRDAALGRGGPHQLCVRDDHRHRPELRLSAAPPCDGGNPRAIPARYRRGPDDRGDLRDRARRGLRHLRDTNADRVRRRPPRMGHQRVEALHLERVGRRRLYRLWRQRPVRTARQGA